jgi:hypothetical protein
MRKKTHSVVQYYIVESSLNHHCHRNATIYSTSVVGVDVTVIDRYKIICTAVRNKKY